MPFGIDDILIPIAISAIGGAVSGNATKNAQNDANAAAAKAQKDQLAQQMSLYLLSRGINPGNIPGLGGDAGSQVNTLFPVGANFGGVPVEQYLLNSIFGASGAQAASPNVYASDQNINAFFSAHPDVLQEITDNMAGSDDQRSPAQWLHDHVTQTEAAVGGGRFTSALKDFATQQVSGGGGTSGGTTGTTPGTSVAPPSNITTSTKTGEIPPEIAGLNSAAIASLNKVYNGGFLSTEQDALDQINKARNDVAATVGQRNTELRGGVQNILNTGLTGLDSVLGARNTSADNILNTQLSGIGNVLGSRTTAANNILNTQMSGLDTVLGSRNTAAGNILNTELSGLSNLRGTGETGANNIYGAELGVADTYENAVKQATSRAMEINKAQRALRGFSGDSSGDALTRARTLASGYQQAGGVRAQAGVNLQNLLNQYRTQEAAGQLTSRSKNATSLGDASIQDALGRLNARTQNASLLGDASIQDALARLGVNTQNATARGASLEQDALGRYGLNNDYAKSLAGILDSDASMAAANAALQNAGANATLVGSDINRQLGSLGTANNLYGSTLGLSTAASNAKYADINALMNSLGFLKSTPPPVPTVNQVVPSPVINSGQIFGSGLTSIGSGISDYMNTQNLIALLSGRKPAPTSNGSTTTTPGDSLIGIPGMT